MRHSRLARWPWCGRRSWTTRASGRRAASSRRCISTRSISRAARPRSRLSSIAAGGWPSWAISRGHSCGSSRLSFRSAPARRADFALVALGEHAVFEGIDRARLETRRGVAGFYGRGHAPAPPGGRALTGVGPQAAPIDWVWERPAGGALLMHAGNDLWTVCDEPSVNVALAERIVAWCAGATAPWS